MNLVNEMNPINWDNSVEESFFPTSKIELIHQ